MAVGFFVDDGDELNSSYHTTVITTNSATQTPLQSPVSREYLVQAFCEALHRSGIAGKYLFHTILTVFFLSSAIKFVFLIFCEEISFCRFYIGSLCFEVNFWEKENKFSKRKIFWRKKIFERKNRERNNIGEWRKWIVRVRKNVQEWKIKIVCWYFSQLERMSWKSHAEESSLQTEAQSKRIFFFKQSSKQTNGKIKI